ncbi:MAG: MFS transporter [Sphaerochaetaceae bacterium]|nr:MFS transporter [Sphaerochaetaceae bacterium]
MKPFGIKNIFKENSPYKLFLTSLLCIGLSYGIYKGVLDNYLAQIVGMGEFDRGVTEFFRELPGFLLVLILAALYSFSAEKIFKIGSVIMLFGLFSISVLPASSIFVILSIFIYSTGEHIQMGMKNTLSLEYAKEGKGGEALGLQSSLSNFGNIFGYIITAAIFLFTDSELTFRITFLLAFLLMLISSSTTFKLKGSQTKADSSSKRFYFKKKYTKYYFLEIFYGARKQIFMTFGPYVLILFYGASATIISALFAISAICCFICAPLLGKLIDKIGYKIVMVTDTLILVIVCFFYGFAHHIFSHNVAFVVCCINYVLDTIISLTSMASNVYVKDLSDSPEETRATITTGISVNHFISIIIALFGGWIWQELGIEVLFSLSAFLGLCNSAYAASIKVKKTSL